MLSWIDEALSMNKKTLLVVAALGCVTVISIATKPNSEGLVLPSCDTQPFVDTEVHFIVDNEVLEQSNRQEVSDFFTRSIKQSNLILTNSCIPMTRSLGTITYVEIDKDNIHDMYTIHRELENRLNTDNLHQLFPMPNQYYGLVLEKKYQDITGFSGMTETNLSQQFFALTMHSSLFTLEHELGHLAWAEHLEGHPIPNLGKWLQSTTSPDLQHHLKPYARAYKCGTAGTVMSYENEILPIYSNPETTYRAKVCGNAENGDNARVLREFAHTLAEKLDSNL